MSFIVEIATTKAPKLSRTVPVFATKREAEHYAEHLCRTHEFVRSFAIVQSRGRPTAEWTKGRRMFRWLGKEERA